MIAGWKIDPHLEDFFQKDLFGARRSFPDFGNRGRQKKDLNLKIRSVDHSSAAPLTTRLRRLPGPCRKKSMILCCIRKKNCSFLTYFLSSCRLIRLWRSMIGFFSVATKNCFGAHKKVRTELWVKVSSRRIEKPEPEFVSANRFSIWRRNFDSGPILAEKNSV